MVRPLRAVRVRGATLAGCRRARDDRGAPGLHPPFADVVVPTSRGGAATVLGSRRISCGRGVATAAGAPRWNPGGPMALSSFRRTVGRVAIGALVVAVPVVLAPVAASAAAPPDLMISEYVEGSGQNKAIEIWNGTGASVDLAAAGYSVQFFANANTTAGLTIGLTGSVAAGDVYVLAQSTADAAIIVAADQTNSSTSWFNGNDTVVLLKGADVIDSLG